ncbi:MAG: FAD-dependent oxidoreductase, partial [Geminicoccaceae bacterium]
MKDHAQVVIIGGGIVGCSVLYHLATLGWQDILLIEQDELSAGSTWHAAGSFSRFDMLPNLIRLRNDSLRLYDQLATAGEHPFEIHRTGGMILATDEQRLQELKLRTGLGRSLGMPHVLLSRHEVSAHHPLTDTTGIVGGLYDPLAGHVDPAGLTHALAQGAMKHGGSISERTKVIAMSEEADGSWLLVTDQGEVLADVVVNAAGLWADAVADMIGVDVPIAMIEHQYMATDEIDEVRNIDGELPSLCAPDDSYQLRHDRHGLLLRAFDDEASSWTLEQIQPDFGKTLLDGSPERLAQAIGDAAKRVPCLDGATFKPAVNGPLTVSPDGRPLLGPLPGFSNYFLACGFMDGLSLAGGAGKALAEWIVEGEPPLDLFALDATRFGEFARQSYTVATARDAYRRYYAIRFPKDDSSAGRPLKRAAIYDKLASKGAQFDAVFGWERPCWYAEN